MSHGLPMLLSKRLIVVTFAILVVSGRAWAEAGWGGTITQAADAAEAAEATYEL